MLKDSNVGSLFFFLPAMPSRHYERRASSRLRPYRVDLRSWNLKHENAHKEEIYKIVCDTVYTFCIEMRGKFETELLTTFVSAAGISLKLPRQGVTITLDTYEARNQKSKWLSDSLPEFTREYFILTLQNEISILNQMPNSNVLRDSAKYIVFVNGR